MSFIILKNLPLVDPTNLPLSYIYIYIYIYIYTYIYIYIYTYLATQYYIPSHSIYVRADVVGLYPSIPHESRLNVTKETLENRESKSVPTSDKLKMLEFLLKNNYFEFNRNVKQQLSNTEIGTKCAPPYACIFMDKVETGFLEGQNLNRRSGFDILMTSFLFGLSVVSSRTL